MNRSILLAAGLMFVLLAYFGLSTLLRTSPDDAPETSEASDQPIEVIYAKVSSELHPIVLSISGQTAPDKQVIVKSSTTGTVVATPAKEGTFVRKGALLCGLDVEARRARVDEAKALLNSANVDYEAAKSLAAKGLAPINRETAAKAQVDVASAGLNAAKVELNKTQVRAPFDGVFETRHAEAGDFLAPGTPCGTLVDLSPLVLTAEVSESYAGRLSDGQTGTATLASGQIYPATVRYVSRSAKASTRTFLVEAALDTGDDKVASGVTATLKLSLESVPAVLVSPALLTLADDGQLGMRYIAPDDTINFTAVSIIDDSAKGAWVVGLPDDARIVTIGQEYLSTGMKVTPIRQTASASSTQRE